MGFDAVQAEISCRSTNPKSKIQNRLGVTMKKLNGLISAILTLTLVASAFAQRRAADTKPAPGAASAPSGSKSAANAPRETLIQNATIMTASHGTIKNGSILIRNGKIAEVGPNVK